MTAIGPNPTLRDLQLYIAAIEVERGFDRESILEKCLLLGEEVGELFKTVRRRTGIKIDPESAMASASEELADVFIFLLAIANRLEVDLEDAVRAKELKNSKRRWVRQ